MLESETSSVPAALTPVAPGERIDALDVIRGFALLGIFLMNVEWFTRPIADLGRGIDPGLSGVDLTVSWLVYVLVQGKFWTLFSLLFGMGFAVMLGRAEQGGRAFVAPYLRRIVGLFLFGSLHFVVIWTGDILHNYAIVAFALLLIVTRNWRIWLAALLSVLVVGALLKSGATFVNAAFLLLTGVLMWALARGPVARYLKWGVALYSLPVLAALVGAGAMYAFPGHMPAEKPEQVQKREEQLRKHEQQRADEVRIMSQGSFGEALQHRAEKYAHDLPNAAGLGFLALPMFLIGFWFVRSGVVRDIRAHQSMFRWLATWTIPLGLAMTLGSVWLHAPVFTPGDNRNPAALASMGLFMWAALPLCIGYFSVVAVLAYTRLGSRLLSPLRPAGQMALSNYIGASLIGTLCFYGYGLGWWGQVSRLGQMGFVVAVFALQLVFSHLWMKKFRFGPLEWLWRSITYWRWQPMLRNGVLQPG